MKNKRMYRIKKIKRINKEQYYPQKKVLFGWSNVHYDFYFESLNGAKEFLDDYTTPKTDTVEIIDYYNPKAIVKKDILRTLSRVFIGD